MESAATPFMLRPPGAEELHAFAAAEDDSKSGGKAEKLRVREREGGSEGELGFQLSWLQDRLSSRVLPLSSHGYKAAAAEGEAEGRHASSVLRLTKSACFLCNRARARPGTGKR